MNITQEFLSQIDNNHPYGTVVIQSPEGKVTVVPPTPDQPSSTNESTPDIPPGDNHEQ